MFRRFADLALATLVSALTTTACKKDPDPAPAPSASQAVGKAPPAKPKVVPLPATPKGLPPVTAPDSNPLTNAKAELGKLLFFDKRLSADGTTSCESCHSLQRATAGSEVAKPGEAVRNAPSLMNVGHLKSFFWDGRADTLEKAVKAELSGTGMKNADDPKLEKAVTALSRAPAYVGAFKKEFPERGVTADTLVEALASYLRTLNCGGSPFDLFKAGEETAMTPQQQKGWKLFEGDLACVECHKPPFFSDAYSDGARFHNIGIGAADRTKDQGKLGRSEITSSDGDWGAFRTPSLRNVTKTGPYFHDGSVESLDAAVIRLIRGGTPNDNLSKLVKKHDLKPHEMQSVIDFMGALDCDVQLGRPSLPPSAK